MSWITAMLLRFDMMIILGLVTHNSERPLERRHMSVKASHIIGYYIVFSTACLGKIIENVKVPLNWPLAIPMQKAFSFISWRQQKK